VLKEAEASAAATHNHPEGIKGAQAVATAVFLARKGNDKKEIKEFIEKELDITLSFGWMISGLIISLIRHARGRCRKQLLLSLSRKF